MLQTLNLNRLIIFFCYNFITLSVGELKLAQTRTKERFSGANSLWMDGDGRIEPWKTRNDMEICPSDVQV